MKDLFCKLVRRLAEIHFVASATLMVNSSDVEDLKRQGVKVYNVKEDDDDCIYFNFKLQNISGEMMFNKNTRKITFTDTLFDIWIDNMDFPIATYEITAKDGGGFNYKELCCLWEESLAR